MTTEKEHVVDRTGWPPGPWDNEPDKIQFKTKSGLPALIVRNRGGALCGYVGVTKGHPYFDIVDETSADLDVHGGITYGGKCSGNICHVPEPGEPDDVYWLGFDCAHVGDFFPSDAAFVKKHSPLFDGNKYRDVAYVHAECERLAEQLVQIP